MASGFMADARFWWNVDSHVGPFCPNKIEDVQLVQLGYACKAASTKDTSPPAAKAIFAAVVPGALYTGAANDPLSIAIRTHQKLKGGTQDGRVSPVQNSTGSYDGENLWMIQGLDNCMLDVLKSAWPRLDKHPKCPGALRAVVLRVFPEALNF